jgi:catechol 2,3-dioxygenase-like lactoylglutathione lyase family enzyme
MSIRYSHTNLIAKNWKLLANFYVEVFGCKQNHTTRLSGEYLEKGTGLEKVSLEGVNLQMPGYEGQTPLLEIFQYSETLEKAVPVVANRAGYGHIAFLVDDVETVLKKAIEHGATKLGEISSNVYSKGVSTYIYLYDPEGNIVELQSWLAK